MVDFQMLCSGAGGTVAEHRAVTKACNHCGKELPLSSFFKSGRKLTARCRQCHGLSQKVCQVCRNNLGVALSEPLKKSKIRSPDNPQFSP